MIVLMFDAINTNEVIVLPTFHVLPKNFKAYGNELSKMGPL